MSILAELLVDVCVHPMSPGEYAASTNPSLWVPGAYAWAEGDAAHACAVFPRPDGSVDGFIITEKGDEVYLHVPKGLRPSDCMKDAVAAGSQLRLTEHPQQVRALYSHIVYCGISFPAKEISDEFEDTEFEDA